MNEKDCHSISGILLGSALDHKKLLRYCLLDLLKDENINQSVLEGLISVLLKDTEAESSIKKFAKQLDISGQLLMNLMEITSIERNNFTSAVKDLIDHNSRDDENQICTSIINLFNKDMSSFSYLASKLGVDFQKAAPVIAAPLGNLVILKEYLP